jgi:hypothetical protein
LIVEFELLIAEVRFTLIAVDVGNQEALLFLRSLPIFSIELEIVPPNTTV